MSQVDTNKRMFVFASIGYAISIYVGTAPLLRAQGLAMTYYVVQEYLSNGDFVLEADQSLTGVVGLICNCIMYLSMPFLFDLFPQRWAHRRQMAALCGAVLASGSFLLSSYSKTVGNLGAT